MIPGARSVSLDSGRFAAGPDGWLAVAGSASMGDGRATSFAALISRDGRLQKVMELSPFAPRAMTMASDGTLWMAGVEVVAGQETNPDHRVLRRFDKAGRMVGSAIPRSSLPIRVGYTHPAEYSYLVSSKDRVGWYSEAAGAYILCPPRPGCPAWLCATTAGCL